MVYIHGRLPRMYVCIDEVFGILARASAAAPRPSAANENACVPVARARSHHHHRPACCWPMAAAAPSPWAAVDAVWLLLERPKVGPNRSPAPQPPALECALSRRGTPPGPASPNASHCLPFPSKLPRVFVVRRTARACLVHTRGAPRPPPTHPPACACGAVRGGTVPLSPHGRVCALRSSRPDIGISGYDSALERGDATTAAVARRRCLVFAPATTAHPLLLGQELEPPRRTCRGPHYGRAWSQPARGLAGWAARGRLAECPPNRWAACHVIRIRAVPGPRGSQARTMRDACACPAATRPPRRTDARRQRPCQMDLGGPTRPIPPTYSTWSSEGNIRKRRESRTRGGALLPLPLVHRQVPD